jgi:adenylate cyclase class 2
LAGTAPTETEVKIRVAAASAREALRRAGAELAEPRAFEDNLLFDDARGALRAAGGVVRLRRLPAGGLLTFKGARRVEDGLKTREEIETAVDDPDAMQAMLERLGLRPVFRYQKHREGWRLLGQSVLVDETPVGDFIEIEGEAEGIHRVAEALGFSRADYLTDSYVGIFFAQGGKGDMVFP